MKKLYLSLLFCMIGLMGCESDRQFIAESGNKSPARSKSLAESGSQSPTKGKSPTESEGKPSDKDKPAAEEKEKKTRKLLVYSKASGFKHDSIPTCKKTIEKMAQDTKAFDVTFNDDASFFTEANLKQFDAILFNNSSQVQKAFKEEENRKAFLNYIKNGGGFIAIHAATDGGGKGWPEYTNLVGGNFDGHPWHKRGTWGIKNEDPKNPIVESLKGKDFKLKEELFKYKNYDRKKIRVILSIDTKVSPMRGQRADKDHALLWIRKYGKGNVFVSAFGHNHEIFKNEQILDIWLKGIKFAMGDLEVDTTSLPQPK